MPNHGPKQYVVIYAELDGDDISESEVFHDKEKAEEFINSQDNKAYLVGGYDLDTMPHT